MFTYTKQPAETIVGIGIDYEKRLASTETISSQTVTAATADITIDSSYIDGTQVLATISGGADGDSVELTYTATTSIGQILEGEILVKIKEK